MVLISSPDIHGSSLAVLKDSAAELDNREGIKRCGGLSDAGGVISGVGGFFCAPAVLSAVLCGREGYALEAPFEKWLVKCGTLSRDRDGGVGGNVPS